MNPTDESLPEGTLQLPPQWSTLAPEVDRSFMLIFWISVVVALAIFLTVAVFAWRYRRRAGVRAKPTGHSTLLEVAWTAGPLVLLVYLFHVGFTGYAAGRVAPDDALTIRVRAMQWNWEFEHTGGVVDDLNTLRVPARTPIRLVMGSLDVLHSFFVPAFRVKRDVVPGMYSTLWFEVPRETPVIECARDADCPEGLWCGNVSPGDMERTCAIPIFCAEYCGAPAGITASAFREGGRNTNHSTMMGDLRAISEEEYWQPIIDPPGGAPGCSSADDLQVCWGQQIHSSYCVACHSVDGVAQAPAPNWAGLWRRERAFVDGSSAVADANYIRQSILQPQSQVVTGYASVNMPPFRFSDRQIDAIVAYIRSLAE